MTVLTPAEFANSFAQIVDKSTRRSAAKGMTEAEMASRFGVHYQAVGGLIYFVQPGEDLFIKIGFATNVERRLCSMRTDNHRVLRVRVLFQGSKATEAALHEQFAKLHHRAEWFRLEGKLARAIEYVRAHVSDERRESWDQIAGRS